ncbi:MAG: hypothetical protein I4N50_07420, partial [Rhizobium sp.]|nr:hypothetical protein [Rhizobium sp.]
MRIVAKIRLLAGHERANDGAGILFRGADDLRERSELLRLADVTVSAVDRGQRTKCLPRRRLQSILQGIVTPRQPIRQGTAQRKPPFRRHQVELLGKAEDLDEVGEPDDHVLAAFGRRLRRVEHPQRVLHQRKLVEFVLEAVQQPCRKVRQDLAAPQRDRPLDRLLDLVAIEHRREKLAVVDQPHQSGIARALLQLVGADGDDDIDLAACRRRLQQYVDKVDGRLGVRLGIAEQLLELIDQDHDRARADPGDQIEHRVQVAGAPLGDDVALEKVPDLRRPFARAAPGILLDLADDRIGNAAKQIVDRIVTRVQVAEDPVGSPARQEAGLQMVHQPGPRQGRLAATGGSGDAKEMAARKLDDHLADMIVTTEEDVALVLPERPQ